ncbi:MAG: porin [Proteobacteria bacterium]|nr:porin [Pseudomonadota bacterium]
MLSPCGSRAEEATPASPALADVSATPGLTATGYLDVSYEHLSGIGLFANGAPNRVFDDRPDSLVLHQAAVTIAYQPKQGLGGLVNVIAGQDPNVFAAYDVNPDARSYFDVPQAFLQYATGAWTLIAGRYVTLAGAESIDPRADGNFSRSILFGFAIPFTHTGVRATYAASDQLSFVLGINNGWDALKDTNGSKTAELAVLYTPTKALSLTAQGYFGKERVGGLVGSGPEGQRRLVDIVATWSVTDVVSLGLNYDWARQAGAAGTGLTADNVNTARWDGIAAYASIQLSNRWRVSLRGEYFDDQDGYRTGIRQKWKEGTVTVGFAPTKPLELRLEARYDRSDSAVFVRRVAMDPETGAYTDLGSNQTSVALEALYRF